MTDYKLKDIEVNNEECILRKIHHYTFARTLLWLNLMFESGNNVVYASDLAKVLKLSYSRAYLILKDFANLNLIQMKKLASNFVEFHPIYNNHHLVLSNYVPLAKKTLGIE